MPWLSSGNHKAGNIATGGLILESIENPVHHYTVNWYLPRSIEMLTALTKRWHFVQPGNGNRLRTHILSQTCNRCFNSSQSKLSLTLTTLLLNPDIDPKTLEVASATTSTGATIFAKLALHPIYCDCSPPKYHGKFHVKSHQIDFLFPIQILTLSM